MNNILAKIIQHKQQELVQRKKNISLTQLQEKINSMLAPKDFVGAIQTKIASNQPAIIAEIKKASPSRGIIREDFNPSLFAKSYARAGATCLSVLTDMAFFQGSDKDLQDVRQACNLPLLRKDFIVDPYQIYESRGLGADCILLIVAALSDAQLQEFSQLAQALKLAILIEVHDINELQRALPLKTPLIGINNRNLKNFVTTLTTTIELVEHIPLERIVVSESGIESREDIALLSQHGVHSYLIGESFMRAPDPGKKLRELIVSS